RLSRLVDAILHDVVEMERGELRVEVSTFDAAELVGDVVEDFGLATRSHEFTFQSTSASAVITSDRVRLYQIVVALIDNAVKYSPRGQTISVEMGGVAEAIWIRVIDRGIGIPTVEQPSIFNKFYRAANAASTTPGLGIGLYLALGLAERLRG